MMRQFWHREADVDLMPGLLWMPDCSLCLLQATRRVQNAQRASLRAEAIQRGKRGPKRISQKKLSVVTKDVQWTVWRA